MGKTPPCSTCLPPLDPKNREAWEVYRRIKRQYVALGGDRGGEPVDLDINAIIAVMKLQEVKHPLDCLDKILYVGRHEIATIVDRMREI